MSLDGGYGGNVDPSPRCKPCPSTEYIVAGVIDIVGGREGPCDKGVALTASEGDTGLENGEDRWPATSFGVYDIAIFLLCQRRSMRMTMSCNTKNPANVTSIMRDDGCEAGGVKLAVLLGIPVSTGSTPVAFPRSTVGDADTRSSEVSRYIRKSTEKHEVPSKGRDVELTNETVRVCSPFPRLRCVKRRVRCMS